MTVINAQVRITRLLYERVRRDLLRPHPFAAERVGFLRAKVGNRGGDPLLVLLTDFWAVPDDQYVDDPHAGARIGATAIRTAMQAVLDTGDGVFQTHMHPHAGRPRFSAMDQRELPKLVQSFRVVGPRSAHGVFLLSHDSAAAFVWTPGDGKLVLARKVSVVGYPTEVML